MARDPAAVGGAPVDVAGLQIEDVTRACRHLHHVPPCTAQALQSWTQAFHDLPPDIAPKQQSFATIPKLSDMLVLSQVLTADKFVPHSCHTLHPHIDSDKMQRIKCLLCLTPVLAVLLF